MVKTFKLFTLLTLLACIPAFADAGMPDAGDGLDQLDVPGQPKTLDVKLAHVTLQDGGTMDVNEGCWLSTSTCIRSARREQAAHNEVVIVERERESYLTSVPLYITLGLIATAFAAGIAVTHLQQPPAPTAP